MTARDPHPNPTPTLPNGGSEPSRDLLEHIFESLPSALVVFDNDLHVILANEAARTLSLDDGDISAAISRLAIDSQTEDWDAELRSVIAGDRPQQFRVTVRGDKGQPHVHLSLTVSPLRTPDTGKSAGGVVLAEDVSSRIGMENQLARSERLATVGKLAARVAHELNNPLDGILRYTNLAIRVAGDTANPKAVEYLQNAMSGIARMREIIAALLEFSRTAPGTLEQATINKIAEDAVAAMEGRIQEANVTVVCDFHQTDMPVVRGSNIFQVFCNIVKNAIDAMPDGGTLTISTAVVGPDVVVKFEDTGIGLPDDVDRIFEPFFTTKEPGRGTGLGLAVCKELIERYGGTTTAERRHPKGTTLTVRIPVRNCAALPANPLKRNRSSGAPESPATDQPPVANPQISGSEGVQAIG